MIESIQFKNFQVLRDTTLPLAPCTLIVGPNGSGKSTVLKALGMIRAKIYRPEDPNVPSVVSVGKHTDIAEITIHGQRKCQGLIGQFSWHRHGLSSHSGISRAHGVNSPQNMVDLITGLRLFSFDASCIAASVQLTPNAELQSNGGQLAAVLDRLRDQHPERFDALNQELGRWLPEFDRVLFETPSQGQRAIVLRTHDEGHRIPAQSLSQGTLIAIAILTLAYLPNPPTLVGIEEPDRGLHPRLLRDVRDAMYRLAYPESCGEKRDPVQVLATTHSPYFLELFREHPEEIIIAEKAGLEARFQRLSDRADLHEILGDAHLGEVWYSGVLGGVPAVR